MICSHNKSRPSIRLFYWVLAIIICIPIRAYPSDNEFCLDLKYLMEQAKNQFSTIQAQTDKQEDNTSKFIVADAESCQFSLGINSSSYQCFWKFDYGSEQADQQFEKLRTETQNCIGHLYSEQIDDSVNHPDSYSAYYYVFADGQVNVALKDKAITMNTYISVRVDAFK